MTRAQALTVSVLSGFVILACIGLIAFIILPNELLFPATAYPTSPPPPTFSPTSPLPKFIPTTNLEPAPVSEATPTPVNTRVPTATPRPPRPPTPTVFLQLTLPPRKPTVTPTRIPQPAAPTSTPVSEVTPTPYPRQYNISFEAEETRIEKDDCTTLRWKVEGASSVKFEGKSVAAKGKEKVCPEYDTRYKLTVDVPDGAKIHRTVKIFVKEKNN